MAAGWKEWLSADKLTEQRIISCVYDRWKKQATIDKSRLVDQAARSVSMEIHISDDEDRIWSLSRMYSKPLRAAGYGNVIETKTQIAINDFLNRHKPFQLHCRMLNIITWRKNDNFHNDNYFRFAIEVACKSKKYEVSKSSHWVMIIYQEMKTFFTKTSFVQPIQILSAQMFGPRQHHKEHEEQNKREAGPDKNRKKNYMSLLYASTRLVGTLAVDITKINVIFWTRQQTMLC